MARKKHRDAKFIIYQCLYIFVIAFLAMKDATILSAGEDNPNKLKPTETKIAKLELDSIKKALDSLKNFNIFVDISKDTIITKQVVKDKDDKIAERKDWVPFNKGDKGKRDDGKKRDDDTGVPLKQE